MNGGGSKKETVTCWEVTVFRRVLPRLRASRYGEAGVKIIPR